MNVGKIAMLLLILVSISIPAYADLSVQSVWYQWTFNDLAHTSTEFTLKWNSGTTSGYLEEEQLWFGPRGHCFLLEVGTMLTDDNRLFLYIASYELEPSGDWGPLTWEWWSYYSAARKYHTIWVRATKESSTSVRIHIYDCTTGELIVNKLVATHSGTIIYGLGNIDAALEYDDGEYDANGIISFQKISGKNWNSGNLNLSTARWLEKPEDRMHATLTCDTVQGCTIQTGLTGLPTGRMLATDATGGPVPTNKERPPRLDLRDNTPTYTSQPSTMRFTYLPYITRCAGAVRTIFNGWWSE